MAPQATLETMLRKALIVAIAGLGLQLVIFFGFPFATMAARFPAARLDSANLFAMAAALIHPVALILLFVAIYREISGTSTTGTRRLAAFGAAMAVVLQLLQALWQSHIAATAFSQLPAGLDPPLDAIRNWPAVLFLQVLRSLVWFALLLVFCGERMPFTNRWIRPLTAFLCVLTTGSGVWSVWRMSTRFGRGGSVWNVLSGPAVAIFGWVSLVFLLVAIYQYSGSLQLKRTNVSEV